MTDKLEELASQRDAQRFAKESAFASDRMRLRTAGAGESRALGQDLEIPAFLHDSCRVHDNQDPLHGTRAAHLARELHGGLLKLAHEELVLLTVACEGHSDGGLVGDITVLTCWDADRLDLGRVGIRPHPSRLCTPAARRQEMVDWAYRRSVRTSPY